MRLQSILLLVRAFLNGAKPLRTYFSRLSGRNKKVHSKILNVVVMLLLLASLVMMLSLFGLNYYSYHFLGAMIGIPNLSLFLATMGAFIMLFFFSATGVSSILYRNKDLDLVLSMPVTEAEVVASRLVIAYAFYSPLYWAILFPAVIVGVLVQGFSLSYGVFSLVLLITGPLVPLSMGIGLSTLLVRVGKGKHFKLVEELVSMVSMVVFLVFMSANFSRNLLEGPTIAFDYQKMVQQLGGLFSKLVHTFPYFSIQAAMPMGIASLLLGLAITIGVTALFIALVARSYGKTLSMVVSNQGARIAKTKQVGWKQHNPILSLVWRDIVILRSHSVFIFEAVGEIFIPFILLAVYSATGVTSELAKLVKPMESLAYFPQIIFLGLLMVGSISMISSTSVSRQGKLFVLDKNLPMAPQVFIQAKAVLHLVLLGIPNMLYLTLALVFTGKPMYNLLWMIPLSWLTILGISCLHLAIDYSRPVLDWTIAQQAMKSNLNGLLGLGVALLVVILLAVALLGPILIGLPPLLGFVLSTVLAVALLLVAYRVAVKAASTALV